MAIYMAQCQQRGMGTIHGCGQEEHQGPAGLPGTAQAWSTPVLYTHAHATPRAACVASKGQQGLCHFWGKSSYGAGSREGGAVARHQKEQGGSQSAVNSTVRAGKGLVAQGATVLGPVPWGEGGKSPGCWLMSHCPPSPGREAKMKVAGNWRQ